MKYLVNDNIVDKDEFDEKFEYQINEYLKNNPSCNIRSYIYDELKTNRCVSYCSSYEYNSFYAIEDQILEIAYLLGSPSYTGCELNQAIKIYDSGYHKHGDVHIDDKEVLKLIRKRG